MHMGELEGRVHSDSPIGTNRHNFSSFSFPMGETSGGHHDLLSCLPINILLNRESEISRADSGGDGGPGGRAWSAVHGEFAFHAADALVAEHRHLSVVVISMQDEV
jgi:hypothetical protein